MTYNTSYSSSYNLSDFTKVVDASHSDALNRLFSETTGNIRVHLTGSLIFASPVIFPGGRSITIEGDGRSVSVITVQHTGVAITFNMQSLTERVTIRGLTFKANLPPGSTGVSRAIEIYYAQTVASWETSTATIDNIDIESDSTAHETAFNNGIKLSGCWTSKISNIAASFYPPPGGVPIAGTSFIEISECLETFISGCSATYSAAFVLQTGYLEGLRILESNALACGWMVQQVPSSITKRAGFNGNGYWIIGNEINCVQGSFQLYDTLAGWCSNNDHSQWGPVGGVNWVAEQYNNVQNFTHSTESYAATGPVGTRTAISLTQSGSGTSQMCLWLEPQFTNFDTAVTFGPGTTRCEVRNGRSLAGGVLSNNFYDSGTHNIITWVQDNGGLASSNGSLFTEQFNASYLDISNTSVVNITEQTFMVVPLITINRGLAANWNASTYTYTVPITGTYDIMTRVRLTDGIPAGISFGQAGDILAYAGNDFKWENTTGNRDESLNHRIVYLSAGTPILMMIYMDAEGSFSSQFASMIISLKCAG